MKVAVLSVRLVILLVCLFETDVVLAVEKDVISKEDSDTVFRLYDEDQDGYLDLKELRNALNVVQAMQRPFTEDEIKLVMRFTDKSGTEKIGPEEFFALLTKKWNGDDEEDVRDAFRTCDTDGNNSISVSQFGQVLEMMGTKHSEEAIKKKIALVDQDGDGVINFEEFKTLVAKEVSEKEK